MLKVVVVCKLHLSETVTPQKGNCSESTGVLWEDAAALRLQDVLVTSQKPEGALVLLDLDSPKPPAEAEALSHGIQEFLRHNKVHPQVMFGC